MAIKDVVGISFLKNQCVITKIQQNKKSISITDQLTLTYHTNAVKLLANHADKLTKIITKNTHLILSIPHDQVLTQILSVDSTLSDDEIIQHIQSQSLRLFGLPHETLRIDYEIISHHESEQSIIAVACHEAHITEYEDCFKSMGVSIHAIETHIFSISRLSAWSPYSNYNHYFFYQYNLFRLLTVKNGQLLKEEVINLNHPQALYKLNTLSNQKKALLISNENKIETILISNHINFDKIDSTIPSFTYQIHQMQISPTSPGFLISLGASLWSKVCQST